MEYGRLIKVGDRREGAAELYVVAEPDSVLAQELIRNHIADPTRSIEDLGKVTPTLLAALNLSPGKFSRA
jgi:hypothetical protein